VKFKVTVNYGHCDIRAWSRLEGNKLIGMGSKTCYDEKGNITSYSETETGVVLSI